MGVFEAIGTDSHEEVLYGVDHASDLRTIIAIHSTVLDPALGGTRFFRYDSDDEALHVVLPLAKGMTYTSAVPGLDLGGGKAVIIGDPHHSKSERILRAYGRVIDSRGGRSITAEDVGTTLEDRVDVTAVLDAAERDGTTPQQAAAVVAEERVARIGTLTLERRSGGSDR